VLQGAQCRRRSQHPAGKNTDLGAIGQNIINLKENIGFRRLYRRARVTVPSGYQKGAKFDPAVFGQLQSGGPRGDFIKRADNRPEWFGRLRAHPGQGRQDQKSRGRGKQNVWFFENHGAGVIFLRRHRPP